MSTNIQISLNAVDNASSAISTVGSSAKSLVLGFNNVASSALNLYNMVDRVKDSQVMLDRANLTVKKSAESVRDAQNNLTQVLKKFGAGSEQAVDAQKRLELAQESCTVATERADMAAENQRKTMLTMAVSIVPTVITGIAALAQIVNALNITTQAGTVLKFSDIAAMVAHKIASYASAAAQWVLNASLATQVGLLTLGVGLVVAAAATAIYWTQVTNMATTAENKFTTSIEASTGAMEDWRKIYQQGVKVSKDFAEEVNYDYRLMKAGADENLSAIAAKFDEAFSAGKINDAILQINRLRLEYNLTYKDARQVIEDFLESSKKVEPTIEKLSEAQIVFNNLVQSYNVEKARKAGKDFVDAYTKAWESGSMLRAIAVAVRFANAMKIDLQDAVNILDELMRKIEEPAEAAKAAGGYDWQNLGGTGPVYGLGPGQIMPASLLGPAAQFAAGGKGTEIAIDVGTPINYRFEFHAPLVAVIGGGGGSQQNLKMVAGMIQESLKRVVIEASSINAPASEKQIRISNDVSSFSIPTVQMATRRVASGKIPLEFSERYY